MIKKDIDNLLRDKKDNIKKIAQEHGVSKIYIFGSFARGESDEKSDLDFLVDISDSTSSWFPAGLIIDLENLLKIKVDVATVKGLKERIRNKVLQEAKPL